MASKTGLRSRPGIKPPEPSSAYRLALQGLLLSLLLSAAGIAVLALTGLAAGSAAWEVYLPYLLTALTLLSIFAGSCYAARRRKCGAAALGLIIGCSYIMIALLLGIQLQGAEVTMVSAVLKLAAGGFTGIAGGVVGVNL